MALECRVEADLALGDGCRAPFRSYQALVREHPFRETPARPADAGAVPGGPPGRRTGRLSRHESPPHRGTGYRAGRVSAATACRDPRPRSCARPADADPRCRCGNGNPTRSPTRRSGIPYRVGRGRPSTSLAMASFVAHSCTPARDDGPGRRSRRCGRCGPCTAPARHRGGLGRHRDHWNCPCRRIHRPRRRRRPPGHSARRADRDRRRRRHCLGGRTGGRHPGPDRRHVRDGGREDPGGSRSQRCHGRRRQRVGGRPRRWNDLAGQPGDRRCRRHDRRRSWTGRPRRGRRLDLGHELRRPDAYPRRRTQRSGRGDHRHRRDRAWRRSGRWHGMGDRRGDRAGRCRRGNRGSGGGC